MSISVYSDRRQIGQDDSVDMPRSWRETSVEARLSPHAASNLSSLLCDSYRDKNAQLSGQEVDRTKKLSSFSVDDILGPRYGSLSHHHHQQHQQQHSIDDDIDDGESTSTRSNEDLSSSVLSHDSSTDGPSPTGSDRAHYWTETEHQLSTSREL